MEDIDIIRYGDPKLGPSGYQHCACYGCFELIVTWPGAYCDDCIEHGCHEHDREECLVPSETMIHRMECLHGNHIGKTCGRCGVVGGSGPNHIEIGQIWRSRGGSHEDHELVIVAPSPTLEHCTTRKPIVVADVETLHDEFFYVGSTMDPIEDLLDAATRHAVKTDNANAECLDLQAIIYAAWDLLTPAQRQELVALDIAKRILKW